MFVFFSVFSLGAPPSYATLSLPVTSLNTNNNFDPAGTLFGVGVTVNGYEFNYIQVRQQ